MLTLLLALPLVAPLVQADPDPSGGWDAFSATTLFRFLDNDAFAHEDNGYSNGLSLALVSERLKRFEDGPLPGWIGRRLDGLSFLSGDGVRTVSHSLSQRLFTPSDIEVSEPDPDDLPYSALLYLLSTASTQDETTLRAVSVGLGVVGPLALGEEAQKTVHGWIGSTEPKGWDAQIGNEAILHLALERRDRLARFGTGSGFGGDFLSDVQGTIGTLQTAGHVSLTARAGLNVPNDFQIPSPFLGEETIGLRPTTPNTSDFGLHGFANIGLDGIARAVWLDGRFLGDSPSVDHDPFVIRASLGFVTRWRGIQLTVAMEQASLPFDPPDGSSSETFARFGLTFGA